MISGVSGFSPFNSSKYLGMTNEIDPWEAATNDDLDGIIAFIDAGGDVNCRDGNNNTPLHWACQDSHFDIVGVLMSRGAEIDPTNNFQSTPLHYSAREGNVDIVTGLIHFGANLESRNKDNLTPLHVAAGMGHAEVTKVLVDNGADIEAVDNALYTPLWRASYYGHVAAVEVLINAGANRDAMNKKGKKPGQVIAPSVDRKVQSQIRALLNVDRVSISARTGGRRESNISSSPNGSGSPFSSEVAKSVLSDGGHHSEAFSGDESEVPKLQLKISKFEEEIKNMHARMKRMDSNAVTSAKTILEQEDKIKAEKLTIKKLESDLKEKGDKIDKLNVQLSETLNELHRLKESTSKISSTEFENLKKKLEEKEEEVSQLNEKLFITREHLNTQLKRIEELVHLEEDSKAKDAEIDALTWQLSKKDELNSRSEEINSLKNELQAKDLEINNLSEQLRKAEMKSPNHELRDELQKLKVKYATIEASLKSVENHQTDSPSDSTEDNIEIEEPPTNSQRGTEVVQRVTFEGTSNAVERRDMRREVNGANSKPNVDEAVKVDCKCTIM